MCLGVPGLIVETHFDCGTPMATVDFGGVTRLVSLALTADAGVCDFVIVHAGFAIGIIDEAEARAALEVFAELGIVEGGGGS